MIQAILLHDTFNQQNTDNQQVNQKLDNNQQNAVNHKKQKQQENIQEENDTEKNNNSSKDQRKIYKPFDKKKHKVKKNENKK